MVNIDMLVHLNGAAQGIDVPKPSFSAAYKLKKCYIRCIFLICTKVKNMSKKQAKKKPVRKEIPDRHMSIGEIKFSLQTFQICGLHQK